RATDMKNPSYRGEATRQATLIGGFTGEEGRGKRAVAGGASLTRYSGRHTSRHDPLARVGGTSDAKLTWTRLSHAHGAPQMGAAPGPIAICQWRKGLRAGE